MRGPSLREPIEKRDRLRHHHGMTRPFLALAALLGSLLLQTPALAQVNATAAPAPGTPQRAAILNALRPPIQTELRGPVEFVVECIRVHNGWAFVMAEPQRPGGRAIDNNSIPDADIRDGLTVTAVLRYRNNRWRPIEQAVGATDVWWEPVTPAGLRTARCY